MPLNVVFLRPQNWSRLKPYYQSTTTAVKVKMALTLSPGRWAETTPKVGVLPEPLTMHICISVSFLPLVDAALASDLQARYKVMGLAGQTPRTTASKVIPESSLQ